MKAIALLLVWIFAGATSHARALDPRTSIPEFAQICGVRVGRDTMEHLENILGHGLPQIGGHAHGARFWRVPHAGCDVHADGFFYTERSRRVIDEISIYPLSRDARIPVASFPRKQARFLGVVSLGMTREQVLRTLKSTLPVPEADDDTLTWKSAGFFRVSRSNGVINREWKAILHFESGVLSEIQILGFSEYEPGINRVFP